MSLYLAKRSNNTNAPAAYIAKKLSGYIPAPISAIGVQGACRFKEVAYGLYRTHIDAFVFATHIGKKVFAQAEAYSDLMLDATNLPFTVHPLAFSPKVKLRQDEADSLLKKLGSGATMKTIGHTLEYTIPQPKIADIQKFIQASNAVFTVGPDRFTPQGFKAYIKALSIIEMFLATNYYPAYKDMGVSIHTPDAPAMTVGFAGTVDSGKKEFFFHYQSGLKRDSDRYVECHSVAKRRKIIGQVEDVEMREEEDDVFDNDKEDTHGSMTFEEAATSVVTAKPSGRPASMNFGGPGGVPELPGLVFPYFKGMTRPDFSVIRECFISLFLRLFGDSFEACRENIADLKRGINNLCNTEAGMEISHLMKGIQLCLETQTRLYAIFDGGYRGFVLLGGQFAVWDGSSWIEPVEPRTVKAELSKLDTHGTAIREIARLLSDMEISGAKRKVSVSSSELTTSIQLLEQLKLREFNDYPNAEEFDKYLQSLIWPKPYMQINPDNFITFLDNFFTEILPPSGDIPVYIPTCKAPISDLLFQHLAVFGPDAPSLWNTRGDRISVLSTRESKKGKEKEDVPEVPKEIIIYPKPLLAAYGDWQKIIKDGQVAFNFKERAKEHRGHTITNEVYRKRIWEKLNSGISKADREAYGERDKKRKRTDDPETGKEILGLF